MTEKTTRAQASLQNREAPRTRLWGPAGPAEPTQLSVQLTAEESDGRAGVTYFSAQAGETAPLHWHTHEDELFLIAEGSVRLTADGESTVLSKGGCAFLPRGVVHGYTVLDGPAEFFVVTTPGGFERFFLAAGDAVGTSAPDRNWSRESSRDIGAELGIGLHWQS